MGIGQWELKKRLFDLAGSNTILSIPHARCPMPYAHCPLPITKYIVPSP
ncbi:hypothetical protein [Tolypothrix sp. VBCCA 56010]